MTKLLDLDALASEERAIRLNGEEHVMAEVSVGEFIDLIRKTDEMEDKDLDLATQMELMVDLVSRRFPTAPKDALRGLGITKLNRIIAFTRATAESEAEEATKELAAAAQEGDEGKE